MCTSWYPSVDTSTYLDQLSVNISPLPYSQWGDNHLKCSHLVFQLNRLDSHIWIFCSPTMLEQILIQIHRNSNKFWTDNVTFYGWITDLNKGDQYKVQGLLLETFRTSLNSVRQMKLCMTWNGEIEGNVNTSFNLVPQSNNLFSDVNCFSDISKTQTSIVYLVFIFHLDRSKVSINSLIKWSMISFLTMEMCSENTFLLRQCWICKNNISAKYCQNFAQ